MVENLSVFLVHGGVDGTLAGQPVRVLFSNPYNLANIGGVGASTSSPTAWLPTANVPGNWLDADLVVPAGTFKVKEHQPDGTGGSLLILQK